MKKFISIIALFLLGFSTIAQNIDLWETNVASSNDRTDDIVMSWTIGQLVGNIENENVSLVATVKSVVLLDIKENFVKRFMEVKLFPNPASENININFKERIKDVDIIMYNSNGSVAMQKKYFGNTLNVSTAKLPNGVYIVKAVNNKGVLATKKIVIKH